MTLPITGSTERRGFHHAQSVCLKWSLGAEVPLAEPRAALEDLCTQGLGSTVPPAALRKVSLAQLRRPPGPQRRRQRPRSS
jgi:hypothetical protein